jgi:hypothetical protein
MAQISAPEQQTELQRWVADDRLRRYSRREARAEAMFWRSLRYERARELQRLRSRRPVRT